MLGSGVSPCPLDQMLTLVMKKYLIIRTALHKLYTECWTQRDILACWKETLTVLIYKKGPTDDLAKFRPITLQPVFYKIFAALYRNRIYKFLQANKYIDTNIQKGFGLPVTVYRNIQSY